MVYLLFALLLLTIVAMLSAKSFKKKQKIKEEQLVTQWGKAKNETFDFDKINIYSDLKKNINFHELSPQTKNDIDFDDVFCLVDRTTSKVGQQFLYDVLSNPTNDKSDLLKLNGQAIFFRDNEALRIAVQVQLLKLNSDDAYFMPTLLKVHSFVRPVWYKWVFPSLFFIPLLVILSPLHHTLLLWIMVPLALNVFLHYRNKNYTKRFYKLFQQLNILINICKKLSAKEIPFDNELVGDCAANLKSIQRKNRLLSFDQSTIKDELTQVGLYLYELIKGIFLIEFFTFFSLLNDIDKKQADILYLFKYVGQIDVALSIASLRASNYLTCQPDFISASREFSTTSVYHPLIVDCVTNDIIVGTKSVLITGSNMSGKTTFLRTIALNSVLAQTIFTCFAHTFTTPFVKLHSSIRIDDNLLDGKSYYFEEVTVMAALIKQAEADWQNIFLLDEVFKGTNTIERIASAKAILSYLNKKNNLVFVTSHDVELSILLAKEYEMYHFAETIEDDGLHYDHQLKAGILKTTNAIKILALSNYPAEIIEEANGIRNSLLIQHRKINEQCQPI